MHISREIRDERLGRFLRDTEEDVLRSLLEQFDEDQVMAAAIDAAKADEGNEPAISAKEFRAALRREDLV